MEEMKGMYNNVPAFGSWDYTNELPFTQCFESARRAAGLVRYSYSSDDQVPDLYVAGDLYENSTVTPAVIIVPRGSRPKGRNSHGKGDKKQEKELGHEIKEPPSPVEPRSSLPPRPRPRPLPKAVDEDLYKIPPELVHTKVPKRKRGFGLFSSCLLPVRA